jgi:hypothetical protein
MGTTRYIRRFVVDLSIVTKQKNFSDYMLRHSIEEALQTLNQKKHKLGDVSVTVVPLSGFAEKALDFLEVLRMEMSERAEEAVSSHEAGCDHSEID